MAHRPLASRLLLAGVLAAPGCGAPATPPPSAPTEAVGKARARPGEYVVDDAAWGKFHSKRFQVTVPLPEGKAWKIDDHKAPDLVAVHPPTSSKLSLLATQELDLMNRQRCEERAKNMGWIPASLTTLEDEVHVGPEAYDSRVWVAVDAARPGGMVEGHVFLFGAFLRRCLLVHLSTSVVGKDENILAARLAVGAERIVKGISVDPLRTTDDAAVPKDKPEIKR